MQENSSRSVFMETCDCIRTDILSGALPFGQRLTIPALTSRYGISDTPIREALKQLEGEGLISFSQHRGATVRTFDADFVRNVYDIRILLEAMLARRCAERATPAGIDQLCAVEARLEKAAEAQDGKAAFAINQEFHRVINEIANNREATEVIERHWRMIAALRNRFGFGTSRWTGIIADHRAIIDALRSGDSEGAAIIAAAHAQRAKADLLQRMAGGEAKNDRDASIRMEIA